MVKKQFPLRNSFPMFARLLPPCSCFAILAACSLLACQVPVFRYALERWPADRYEFVILHAGELGEPDQTRLKKLGEANALANFDVRAIDVATTSDDLLSQVWNEHRELGKPVLVILYPRNAREVPDRLVQVLPFTDKTIQHIVDSPVRQQITQKLIEGESAVWIFVPSGNAKEDAVARATLVEQAMLNEKQLELPPQEEIESDEAFLAENEIELRIGFSIVTLQRDDPKEQFLLKMLMASEPDLEELDQPMAFPVLGRGRVLYALVGKGIVRDTIGIASRFIVGPCSCQVKEQNPGFDLLLSFDWDDKIAGSTLSDPLPATPDKPVLLTIPPGKSKR